MKQIDINIVKSNDCSIAASFFKAGEKPANCSNLPFKGDYLEPCLYTESNNVFLAVGLGDKENLGATEIKELFATVASELSKKDLTSFAINMGNILENSDSYVFNNAAQGLILGLYEYQLSLSEEKAYKISLTDVPESQTSKAGKAISEGCAIAYATCFARTLVNTPANMLKPLDMAKAITDLLSPLGVECQTIEASQLKKMGMNGLLLVGSSSGNPPCLLVMRYLGGKKGEKPVALVGKGVTFDSGGYCLKPANGMGGAKGDMAGGAAVAGAISALAHNKISTNVVGIIPLCENRISDSSLVPGDVYTAYSGKTIEVLNTDAEGRLILADAVSYAIKDEAASHIIDIATLTGAVVGAFGFGVAGAVDNNDNLWSEFKSASEQVGERYWRMPTYPEYHEMIKSNIAEIKNIGESHSGSITAGLFIGSFAGETPWLHLDIAGTAWVDSPLFAFQKKGATGSGLASMYQFCVNRAE